MTLLVRIGTLVTVVALSASVGCSKDETEPNKTEATATKGTVAKTMANADEPGKVAMAEQRLLVLKFHHDD